MKRSCGSAVRQIVHDPSFVNMLFVTDLKLITNSERREAWQGGYCVPITFPVMCCQYQYTKILNYNPLCP